MNWESFNWETLLWVGGIILLIYFMMRGCRRMMGGGCGMGGRQHGQRENQGEGPDRDTSAEKP